MKQQVHNFKFFFVCLTIACWVLNCGGEQLFMPTKEIRLDGSEFKIFEDLRLLFKDATDSEPGVNASPVVLTISSSGEVYLNQSEIICENDVIEYLYEFSAPPGTMPSEATIICENKCVQGLEVLTNSNLDGSFEVLMPAGPGQTLLMYVKL